MRMIELINKWLKDCTGLSVNVAEIKDPSFGDYTTNFAFSLGGSPDENTYNILKKLTKKHDMIDKIEAKAGFINIFLSKAALQKTMTTIREEQSQFGSSNKGQGKKVLLEFVSANPTGPLEVPNGRAAAIGDCLYHLLSSMGYSVDKEYYIDDCGRQIELLKESLVSRMRGEEVPEDGYKGEYIKRLADEALSTKSEDLREFAITKMVSAQRKALMDFGVEFRRWVVESVIRESCPSLIKRLGEKGMTYEKEGALWLKASNFGDEKDRVLIKSNGEYTYLTPDIAYHINKFERGYDILIDILGPDHLGHIPPLKTALKSLGYPSENLIVLISQWVTIAEDGKKQKMSKREGRFITLEQILKTVGKDVAKFIFLTRRRESHLVFDMDVVQKESKENPVYYIQYAYARMSSIKRVAEEREIDADFSKTNLLGNTEELAIMRKLVHFPEVTEAAEKNLEPNFIPNYLLELASLFHTFYEKHKVVGNDKDLSSARLALVDVTRQVFGNGLSLLGITAPERM